MRLPESVLKGQRRSVAQRVDDERAILCILLVRPEITTASTMLEEWHFAEPAHAELFEALQECDSQMRPRTVADVAAILKRWQKLGGRLLRQVLGVDWQLVDVARVHFDWFCQMLREAAEQAQELRQAVAVLQKHAK